VMPAAIAGVADHIGGALLAFGASLGASDVTAERTT
jgi:hypothetical protein